MFAEAYHGGIVKLNTKAKTYTNYTLFKAIDSVTKCTVHYSLSIFAYIIYVKHIKVYVLKFLL